MPHPFLKIFLRFLICQICYFLLSHPALAENTCKNRFELSTNENNIIDQCGNLFKLRGVNWYGAHDKAEIVGGLDKQRLKNIVNLIKSGGFNTVRLTFSNHMLHNTTPVETKYVSANPDLAGKTPLQIFDHVVAALTDAGIVVILNNHTTLSEWCCGFDYNGLWHHPDYQSTEQWINDWKMLTVRYQNNPLVAGFDLRNEVRTGRYHLTYLPVFPNWGNGDENDWKNAAIQAGNIIHSINPALLIIVEGINWYGIPMINGYRPLLEPIKNNPIILNTPHKLVYAAHVYAYTGPKHTGDDKSSPGQIKYKDMNEATLKATLDSQFGYVLTRGHDYTAPVWLSEFGAGYKGETPEDRQWLERITHYLLEKNMGWALWALNSQKFDGSEEGFGLLNEDWSAYRDDWRMASVRQLLSH